MDSQFLAAKQPELPCSECALFGHLDYCNANGYTRTELPEPARPIKCSDPMLEANTEAPTYGKVKSFIPFEITFEHIQPQSVTGIDVRSCALLSTEPSATYRNPSHESASQEISAHCTSV